MKKIKDTAVKAKSFYNKHEKEFDAAVFFGGFFFDIFTTGRIDELFNILQQLAYLIVLGLLITLEVKFEVLKQPLFKKLEKVWQYRRLAIHFLLGSLLSVYTIFFFKSGSFATSFAFILLIASLLILNELPFIQNLGAIIRVVLFSLCLGSYFAITLPMLFGFIGWLPFTSAMLIGSAICGLLFYFLYKHNREQKKLLIKDFLVPSQATFAVFFAFYMIGFVPPVPLSLKYIGIYHNVAKNQDEYKLSYRRPNWKFWQNGAQTFLAQPGDKLHCFIEIYSPTSFKDQIFLKWYYDDPKQGWQTWDSIPITVSGGRVQGFRGYGVKQNYIPGTWQVRVLTRDNREVGRINFDVESEEPSDIRQFEVDTF